MVCVVGGNIFRDGVLSGYIMNTDNLWVGIKLTKDNDNLESGAICQLHKIYVFIIRAEKWGILGAFIEKTIFL